MGDHIMTSVGDRDHIMTSMLRSALGPGNHREAARPLRTYRVHTPHQGDQEKARRRRQIAVGSLRAENGLWRAV